MSVHVPVMWSCKVLCHVVYEIETNVSVESASSMLRIEDFIIMKMGTVGSSETFVPFYKSTRRHLPDDRNVNIQLIVSHFI
jgi:hypothetical protein